MVLFWGVRGLWFPFFDGLATRPSPTPPIPTFFVSYHRNFKATITTEPLHSIEWNSWVSFGVSQTLVRRFLSFSFCNHQSRCKMFNLFSKIGKIWKHENFMKRAKIHFAIFLKLVKTVKFQLTPYHRLSTHFQRQCMYLLEKKVKKRHLFNLSELRFSFFPWQS